MIYEMKDKRTALAIRKERSEVDCLLREKIYPSNDRGKGNKKIRVDLTRLVLTRCSSKKRRVGVLFRLSSRTLGNLLLFAPRPVL